jgi:CheY-like chemotaxis protein
MSQKKILLVEDDQDLLEMVELKLSNEGFEVDTAESGQEALDYLRESLPDLVLLDIMLPDIDGLSVLNEIANQPETSNLPVIIYSNVADQGSFEQAEAIGKKYEYLLKATTDLNLLVKKIREKLLM